MGNEQTGAVGLAFAFISQGGELALKSLLLGASLRRYLGGDVELICCIPEHPSLPPPSDDALLLFREWNITVQRLTDGIDPTYPIANKIGCLAVPTTAERIVFLDSDMLCLRSFSPEERDRTFRTTFQAKPADLQTFTTNTADWELAYEAAGVPMPQSGFPTTHSEQWGLPYFNSGVLGVRVGTKLNAEWARCCRAIRESSAVPNKYPWADQISLAIAVHSLGLDYACLHEGWNFPAHLKPLPSDRLPVFCHYHSPDVLVRELLLRAQIQELADAHPGLKEIARAHEKWRPLLAQTSDAGGEHRSRRTGAATPHRMVRSRPADLIITGIARSGTSYLCSLLHRYTNCVVLNEPEEIIAPLVEESLLWRIPLFYQQVRAQICEGTTVRNKVQGGVLVEDTFPADARQDYRPHVDNADFVLGTKNTMSYLARLEALRRVMPNARIIVSIRNPFDTIASWKRTFPHLADADLMRVPVGHPADPWLTARESARVERIIRTTDIARRRALWWHHCAERILVQGRSIELVRYEELVTQPHVVIERILRGFHKGSLRQPITPSHVRSHAHELGDDDLQAIRTICTQSAHELGLS